MLTNILRSAKCSKIEKILFKKFLRSIKWALNKISTFLYYKRLLFCFNEKNGPIFKGLTSQNTNSASDPNTNTSRSWRNPNHSLRVKKFSSFFSSLGPKFFQNRNPPKNTHTHTLSLSKFCSHVRRW
jgi:ribosomal protein L33